VEPVDDELIALFKEHPNVPVMTGFWTPRNEIYGARPYWLDDPLLAETFTQAEIKAFPKHPAIPTVNRPPDFEYLFISPFQSLVPSALVICWTRLAGFLRTVMRSRIPYRNAFALSTLARGLLLICALLLSRPAIWWAYILAPLPLRLLVAVTPGLPLWFLLAAFANDSLKGLVTAILMRRVFHGRRIKFDVLRDFWLYLIITSLIGPALSGVFGAASWYALGREFWPTWRSWFLGDAIANLVLTPMLLYVAQYWRRLVGAKPLRYAEALILFSSLPIAAHEAYKQGIGVAGLIDPLGYLPLALLVWAAIRFGPAGASAALSVVSILAIAGIGASRSALSAGGVMDHTLSIQLFMIVLSIPIMSLAVLVEQLVNTEQSLRESKRRLVSIYNTVEDVIFHLAIEPEGQFRIVSVNAAFLKLTGLSQEKVVGKTVNEVIPEPSLTIVLGKYRQAVQENTIVQWVETSDYPAFVECGRFTPPVSQPAAEIDGARKGSAQITRCQPMHAVSEQDQRSEIEEHGEFARVADG
jgi:integral membrane sensor domain MASE1